MKISQKIIDYAIRYYLRYYPSPKKLKLKLNMKFWPNSEKGQKYWGINSEEIEYILKEKLRNIIQEKEVIQSKIRVYKDKWKSKQYIKQKLYERQEDKELLEIFLEEAFVEWELELVKREYEKIIRKIEWKYDVYKERQKIIEKLLYKWFKYDDIKNVIN